MSATRAELPAWACEPDADVALEWGPHGLRALAPDADAVVVFDALGCTTAADVADSPAYG